MPDVPTAVPGPDTAVGPADLDIETVGRDARDAALPALPPDPWAGLPPLAEPLPADLGLEALYQCVHGNLLRVKSPEWQRRIHVQLAAHMARRDPPRGFAALGPATASKPHPDEAAAVVLSVAARDLRRAVIMAAGLTQPKNRRRALEALVNYAADRNGAWAVVISDQIHDRIPRELFLLDVVARLSLTNLEQSRLLAERIIEPLLNDWAMALVAAREASPALDQALAKVEAIESPVVRDWALLKLTRELSSTAPALVEELMPRVQRSLVRDELLAHLALAVVADSPDKGLALALRIEEPELRRRGLDAVARALLSHKPALARFMVEKKREPPLPPDVWLSWLKTACRDYPDKAPEMLEKALERLSPQARLDGLLNCCPGAPKAVRGAASILDIRDDRLTRCYVCGNIMPDGLVAARTVREEGVRDDALLCALSGLPGAEAEKAIQVLEDIGEPLLRDQAAASLVAALQADNQSEAALELAGTIVDHYLRAPALALLAADADDAVSSTAREAFAMSLDEVHDQWRQDAARRELVRALWTQDENLAWSTLMAIQDSEIVMELLGELMVVPLPASQLQILMGDAPSGAPLALACLRSIALWPSPEGTPNE